MFIDCTKCVNAIKKYIVKDHKYVVMCTLGYSDSTIDKFLSNTTFDNKSKYATDGGKILLPRNDNYASECEYYTERLLYSFISNDEMSAIKTNQE